MTRPIRWTRHARERLEQWRANQGITMEEVERVLRTPEQEVDGYAGTRVAQARRGEGLIRVAYIQEGGEVRVLTLYWTSKVEKYWRS